MLNKKVGKFDPIAIVGLGAIFPGSCNIQEFWKNIVTSNDLITTVPATHWLVDDYYDPDPQAADKTYCKRGGFIPDIEFDPLEFGIPPNNLLVTDNSQLLALVVAKQVLQDAMGIYSYDKDLSRVSVILGTSALSIFQSVAARMQRPIWDKVLREAGFNEEIIQQICDRIASHYQGWQENTFPGLLPNVVAGRIANRFNLGGTNCTIDAACASSLAALSMATNELHLKTADMVITGGVDTLNDIITFMCFSKTKALSLSGDCRPFSDKADGTLLGEGLGMFALKRLEDAEKNQDKIYAVIKGIGTSSDGRSTSIYAPSPQKQKKAILQAYQLAGYTLDTVGLIEAHGTGTQAGDIAEFTALQQAFSETAQHKKLYCALGSVKSQLGHTKCAAGAAGLFKAAMALHHKVLPPTIKIDQPNSQIDFDDSPFYLNTALRPWITNHTHPRRAGISAFGFGGINFHVTLEEYIGNQQAKRLRTVPAELILLTAEDPKALIKLGEEYLHVSKKPLMDLARISQENYEPHHLTRLAIIASDHKDLQRKIFDAIQHIKDHPQQTILSVKDIYYGYALDPGMVAFLFPGQGSQYINMGADLIMTFSQSAAIWELASNVLSNLEKPLHDIVFPRPVFSNALREKQQSELIKTQYAQPALAVTSMIYFNLLKSLTIHPDCAAGHSFGEIMACFAGDAMDASTVLSIAKKRGELMQNSTNVPGAMTSVMHPVQDVLEIIKKAKLPVTPANFNAPQQVVLSGTLENIMVAEAHLHKQHIKFQRLPVADGFHSKQIATCGQLFHEYLKTIVFKKPQIPVYSNTTATSYLNQDITDHLAEHIIQPVRFQEMVENIYQAGVRTFIEVGPSSILSNFVNQCLPDKNCHIVALNERHHHGVLSLWNGLGKLFAVGLNPSFSILWQDYAPATEQPKKMNASHTITLNGTSYGKLYPLAQKNPDASPRAQKLEVEKNNMGQTELMQDAIASSSTSNAQDQIMTPDNKFSESIGFFQTLQQQLVETHNFYQKITAETHIAFLNSFSQIGEKLIRDEKALSHAVSKPITPKKNAPTSLPVISNILHPPSNPPSYPFSFTQKEISSPHAVTSLTKQEKESHDNSDSMNSTQEEKVILSQRALIPAKQAISNQENPISVSEPSPIESNDHLVLQDFLMAIIEEKTGYPRSMLKPEMAIEADLGIDSIKRVEIFSALTEKFQHVPDLDFQQLVEIQTLEDILTFMKKYQLDIAS